MSSSFEHSDSNGALREPQRRTEGRNNAASGCIHSRNCCELIDWPTIRGRTRLACVLCGLKCGEGKRWTERGLIGTNGKGRKTERWIARRLHLGLGGHLLDCRWVFVVCVGRGAHLTPCRARQSRSDVWKWIGERTWRSCKPDMFRSWRCWKGGFGRKESRECER